MKKENVVIVASGPITRYSDKDLSEFREIIHEKLKKIEIDLTFLFESFYNVSNNGIDDTSPSFKQMLEEGGGILSKDNISNLISRKKRDVEELKQALVRIENKSYGFCTKTNGLIPKERLRLVPHATCVVR